MSREPPLPATALRADAELNRRIRAFERELLGFLCKRLPRREAEEVSQDVWLRVSRANPDCANDAAFRGYVYAVARRLLIDGHRRRAARIHLVPLEGDLAQRTVDPSRPDHAVQARDVLLVVQATLDAMKPEMAEVFQWRTTGDLSFKEIARRQGVSLNTALGRMHRALKKIHAALAAEGLHP